MRILLTAIGFVTNSSSTNYWLNDGQLEPGEPGYSSSTPSATSSTKQNNSSSTKNASVEDRTDPNNTQNLNQTTTKTQTASTSSQTPYYQQSSLQNLMIWGSFSIILIVIVLIKKFKK